LRVIGTFYNVINESFDGYLFCLFFNIKSKIRNKEITFREIKGESHYVALTKNYKRFFKAKRQNILSYSNGIQERGRTLGRTYFLDEISFSRHDVVVDCGANVGDLKIYFHDKNIDITYLAFEPAPEEFECLKKNLLLPKSKAFNYALFDKEENKKFFVSSDFGDSTLFRPKCFSKEIKVKTKRFDMFFSSFGLKNIKLLKLEAKGGEPEVLFGCGDVLKNIEYISADLGFERGLEQYSTLPEVANYLIQEGFEILNIMPSRFVCLFKNKNYIKN